jgi:hypothetical protein
MGKRSVRTWWKSCTGSKLVSGELASVIVSTNNDCVNGVVK